MSRPLGLNALTRRAFLRVAGGTALVPWSAWGDRGALCAATADGRLTVRPKCPTGDVRAGVQALGIATGRDALLQVPARYRADEPMGLLLFLHGASGSGEASVRMAGAAAEDAGLILCAPDSRLGTWDIVRGSYGPDVAYIDAALTFVFAHCRIDVRRLAIAGFSDGASYALSLGLINGDLFSHILAFSPGFIGPVTDHGRPLIYVSHGTRDPVLPIDRTSHRFVPELRRRGYAVRFREFAGGHTVPADVMAEAFGWVAGNRSQTQDNICHPPATH